MKERLKNLIKKFKSYKVLVIGDAILDTYIKGATERICREAPVPVFDVNDYEYACGGAANTAVNISALGAQTYFMSVIGKDDSGRELCEELKRNKINVQYVIKDKSRTTLAKKRITASSNIILRIDEGNTEAIDVTLQNLIIQYIKRAYNEMDAIILSDYGYGIINDSLIGELEILRANNPKVLIIDSKDLSRFGKLKPTCVKPNYEEAVKLLKTTKLNDSQRINQLIENAKNMLAITGAYSIAATADVDGTVVLEKGKKPHRIPTIPQDNKRAIGAGDTFISALTLAFSAGASAQDASEIASASATIVTQKDGTTICTYSDLLSYFDENPKRMLLEDLVRKTHNLRKEGKKIVFTNGCFDLLHRGHVNFLNEAKKLGDILIVGLNSDASIEFLKGKGRPINTLEDRIAVLAALHCVDYLVSFETESPAELIKAIKPDVVAKGGNYSVESLPEAELVTRLGGEVKIIPLTLKRSTTQIINKIKKSVYKKAA